MRILDINDTDVLDNLIKLESENINRGFCVSEKLGRIYLSNAINSFITIYLYGIYGAIIPQFSSEYRYFIIGILKEISDDYKNVALSEVLIPSVKTFNDLELIAILSQQRKID